MNAISGDEFEDYIGRASRWIAEEQKCILLSGVPLTALQSADALSIGVKHPERVRLIQLEQIGLPSDPVLLELFRSLGLDKGTTWGRTFFYGIALRRECWDVRHKLAHELAHTKQYEELGSIDAFVRLYLTECLPPAHYGQGPLEREAQQVEERFHGLG